MPKSQTDAKSRVRSVIWNLFERHRWKDYDDFSLTLADRIYEIGTKHGLTADSLGSIVMNTSSGFFAANRLTKKSFLAKLHREAVRQLRRVLKQVSLPLSVYDLFPEIRKVPCKAVERYLPLDVKERWLQDSLRKILRKKGAFPIPDRKSDTAQEVADVEHFQMPIKGENFSMAVVVKGYRSVKGKTLTWEDVSHQVTRAYQRTNPDYILLVSAKDPADGLISSLKEYSRDVGKPNMVIFVPCADLGSLLISHRLM